MGNPWALVSIHTMRLALLCGRCFIASSHAAVPAFGGVLCTLESCFSGGTHSQICSPGQHPMPVYLSHNTVPLPGRVSLNWSDNIQMHISFWVLSPHAAKPEPQAENCSAETCGEVCLTVRTYGGRKSKRQDMHECIIGTDCYRLLLINATVFASDWCIWICIRPPTSKAECQV